MGFTDLNNGTSSSLIGSSTSSESYSGGKTAFGEFSVSPLTPIVQLDAIFGLDSDLAFEYEVYSSLGGNATTEDNLFSASSSDTQYSYGVLRSRRFLRYRPGQGAIGRFTAMFSEPVAGTTQRAGLFNQESAFQVGYNGEDFGILHSYGGKAYISSITVTASPSTSGTITITPPGILGATDTPVVVNLTGWADPLDRDPRVTAREIAEVSFPGWIVQAVGDKVCFLAENTGVRNNDFTFVVGTATGFAATVTEDAQGAFPTDVWVDQDSWNIDRLNGTGGDANPSGVTLDASKLNVFQIGYKWLGAGAISFSVENPSNGNLIEIHRILWSNQNDFTSVHNPSFKIGYVAYNLIGGLDTSVVVKGASMMMAVEGQQLINHLPRGRSVKKDTLAANQIHVLMSIRNPIVTAGKINTRNVYLESASVSSQAQGAGQQPPLEFFLFVDPVSDTSEHIYETVPNTQVQISEETGAISLVQDTPVMVSAVADRTSQTFRFLNQVAPVVIPANTIVTIAVRSVDTTIDNVTASFNWVVD